MAMWHHAAPMLLVVAAIYQEVAAGVGSLAAAAVSGVPRRPERRDNLKDFLAKKRETFLMQVTLVQLAAQMSYYYCKGC